MWLIEWQRKANYSATCYCNYIKVKHLFFIFGLSYYIMFCGGVMFMFLLVADDLRRQMWPLSVKIARASFWCQSATDWDGAESMGAYISRQQPWRSWELKPFYHNKAHRFTDRIQTFIFYSSHIHSWLVIIFRGIRKYYDNICMWIYKVVGVRQAWQNHY